jgi:hypothetical protein
VAFVAELAEKRFVVPSFCNGRLRLVPSFGAVQPLLLFLSRAQTRASISVSINGKPVTGSPFQVRFGEIGASHSILPCSLSWMSFEHSAHWWLVWVLIAASCVR